jgi:hypothetical protein
MYTLEVFLDIDLLHELTVVVIKGALLSFAEVEGVDTDLHVAFPSEQLVAIFERVFVFQLQVDLPEVIPLCNC